MSVGDRICPECGEETLVEKGLTKWVCLNSDCKEEFDEDFLES